MFGRASATPAGAPGLFHDLRPPNRLLPWHSRCYPALIPSNHFAFRRSERRPREVAGARGRRISAGQVPRRGIEPAVPPVWASLTANPNHKAPLPVEGQAGRKRGVRPCKRKKSNGEFATCSRTFALHVAASNSQAEATPSLSQGQSQNLSQSAVVD